MIDDTYVSGVFLCATKKHLSWWFETEFSRDTFAHIEYTHSTTRGALVISRHVVLNLLIMCSLDASFPAYNNRQKTAFFGCMPPESGYTVFSSWLFDAYYPQDEFNQLGRLKLADKVSQIDLDALLANEKTITFAVVRHPMTRFVSSWVNGLDNFLSL